MRKQQAFLLPDVIDPPETVCIRIEIPKDDKHIYAFFGALDVLGLANNWERDSLHSAKQVAQLWRDTIQTARQTWGACEMPIDCNEVEACLTTSPTITTIEIDITNNLNIITNNTNELQEIQENPADGNTYAPTTPTSNSVLACQIAGHLASKIGDYIAQIDTYATELTLLDALNSALAGDFNYAVSELTTILENAVSGANPPLFSDYQSQESAVHEQIYCQNDFNKDNLATWTVSNLSRGQEVSDMLNSISLATWQQWHTLGEHATGYSCLLMCGGWCYEFDFTIDDGGWSTSAEILRDFGVYTGATWDSVWGSIPGPGFDERLYIDWTFDNQTEVTQVEIDFEVIGTLGNAPNLTIILTDALASAFIDVKNYTIGTQTIIWENIENIVDGIKINFVFVAGTALDADLLIKVSAVRISGAGTNAHMLGNNC